MKKLLQINKDAVVWSIVLLWGWSNILTLLVWGAESVIFSNMAFLMLFCLLIVAMRRFPSFNRWLNRDFWEERR